jgi:CO dehydrogenase maturation factor
MMGVMRGAGKGCACAENNMLKALITHLIVREKEAVVMDMVAGTEHMGRGTAKSVDLLTAVVEPGMRSIKAARQFIKLASDLGIDKVKIVGNKIRNSDDIRFIQKQLSDIPVAGFLPLNEDVVEAEQSGAALYEFSAEMRDISGGIVDNLLSRDSNNIFVN